MIHIPGFGPDPESPTPSEGSSTPSKARQPADRVSCLAEAGGSSAVDMSDHGGASGTRAVGARAQLHDRLPAQSGWSRSRQLALCLAATLLLVAFDGSTLNSRLDDDGASSGMGAEHGIGTTGALPTGRVRVESTPTGAHVFLNAQLLGEAPLTLDVPTGRHTIRLESGSRSLERSIVVREDEITRIAEALVSGWVVVFSRVELDVYLDGRKVGTSNDRRLMVPPGLHEFTLVNNDLRIRHVQKLEIRPVETTAYTLELPNGRLTVKGPDGAAVWIDGALAGTTPLRNVSVPVGASSLVVRHPDFGERRVVVDVKLGEPTVLTLP